MSDEGPAQIGELVAGRYEIVRLLGQGGMGAVYAAKQVSMDRMVALKLIRPQVAASTEIGKRFHREMQATSRIEHPNVIQVFDYGEDAGRLFLAMEFLAGKPLSKVIAESGTLPTGKLLHIAQQVTRALGAAHQVGIAHRDLKPDNVMVLERYGEPDFVKVLDFGIARFLDDENQHGGVSQMTAAGALIGTPMYMSPEQALGHAVDHRSDFYSLGVMLYQMAVGQPPFNGPTLTALIIGHAHETPPLPSSVKPGLVAPALEALIMRLLAKTPDERPATAAELLFAIEQVGAGEQKLAFADTALPALHSAARPVVTSAGDPPAPIPTVPPSAPESPPASSTALTPPMPMPSSSSSRALPIVLGSLVLLGGGGVLAWKLFGGGGAVDSGARARLDAVFVADGDPLAPASCQTKDGATIEKLVRASSWLHDSSVGNPRPQDRDALHLLEGIADKGAETQALYARARLVVEPTPAGALESAQAAIAACPTFALAHNVVGNVEQRQKHFDAAQAAYKKALELAPDYLSPRFNLGLLALRGGDAAGALAAFNEVLQKNPQHGKAVVARAQANLVLGNAAEAAKDLQAAALRNPDGADIQLLLGQALKKLGEEKGASEAFCKAKKLGADAPCP